MKNKKGANKRERKKIEIEIKANGIENQQKQRKSTYENYAHIHLIMYSEWQPVTAISSSEPSHPTKYKRLACFYTSFIHLKTFTLGSFLSLR